MVELTNHELEEISLIPSHFFSSIPEIDLRDAGSGDAVVKACEEYGFFKLTNHGISFELMAQLEELALKFFSMTEAEKEWFGPPSPFGYGSKTIGTNGDVGWVEYLLFDITNKPMSQPLLAFLREPSGSLFCSALNEFMSAVRKLAIDVLEMMADGLGIKPRNALSRLVASEGSDSVFRLNHYPSLPVVQGLKTGFGEHTDPQIISVLRSNNSTGYQIALKDGSWVSVPPDPKSFFINVGDTLQVLTNGRFRSVRHRVLANGFPRVSMIYFGGPCPTEKIAPLTQLMGEGEQSLFTEFTWEEYKKASHKLKLADNRLALFKSNKGVP